MTLGRATDGGIAWHETCIIQIHGEQQRFGAYPRRRQGCLAAGMPRPDNNDLVHLFSLFALDIILPLSAFFALGRYYYSTIVHYCSRCEVNKNATLRPKKSM
jgi:hypothetical protein